MKKLLLSIFLLQIGFFAISQTLSENTGLRFYEHHSSTINGGGDFGFFANGTQSGYDFVNHTYYNSFNTANMGAYLNGEEANIDMVEHNGPYGNGFGFGFTSGVSSIWNGNIKGNGTTMWITASGNFDYDQATHIAQLTDEYLSGTSMNFVGRVEEGGVYIARIRNSDMYVAIKCYNVSNIQGGPPFGQQDVSFDFDYKYGQLSSGMAENGMDRTVKIYPNPASDKLTISGGLTGIDHVSVHTTCGKTLQEYNMAGRPELTIDVSTWESGVYLIRYRNEEHISTTVKFIKK